MEVRLIVDGDAVAATGPDGKATGSEYATLAAATGLGTDLAADSWVLACPTTARAGRPRSGSGCRVELLHNGEDGNLGDGVRDAIAGRLDYTARCAGTATDAAGVSRTIGIHSKYLLIEGTYLGGAHRKLVFTGSHNYTFPNLRSHDETLLKIDDAAVYDAFAANFESIKAGPHCAAW
ncbi:phospholipase D-like domain-containing protein [Streptomyces goshikiensis]|uniref:phospholipase D-like domain-containing protein n=1 Tax=Streptomyces goshikiensis TaxID=1942 RepID=UPI0036CF6045